VKTEVPVVVCIGSTSVSGDSLGPIVGDLLREKYKVRAFVYGGTMHPVNGITYQSYVDHIKNRHRNSLVVAVDACVGYKSEVGKIKCSLLGISAGGALNKQLERFGDVGILGVVALRQSDNLKALMTVSAEVIENMSNIAASFVSRLLRSWDLRKNINTGKLEIGDAK
jgi:putative sporulation protein YyaC